MTKQGDNGLMPSTYAHPSIGANMTGKSPGGRGLLTFILVSNMTQLDRRTDRTAKITHSAAHRSRMLSKYPRSATDQDHPGVQLGRKSGQPQQSLFFAWAISIKWGRAEATYRLVVPCSSSLDWQLQTPPLFGVAKTKETISWHRVTQRPAFLHILSYLILH